MTGQPWRPPVYDVHPADQAIREAINQGRKDVTRDETAQDKTPGRDGGAISDDMMTAVDAFTEGRLGRADYEAACAGYHQELDALFAENRRQADEYMARYAGREAGADPLADYWSSMKEGWPRASAEHMALQHARELAIREGQAGREAGQ